MHLALNIAEGEGVELTERYRVGNTYPVFILTDSSGAVISRWTGYTGADRFIQSLRGALSDMTAVIERVARMKSQPTFRDAMFLARYYEDIGEHLLAVETYRLLQRMSRAGGRDYSFQVFQNYVDAAWKHVIPFDEVLPYADSMVNSKSVNPGTVVTVAQLMSKLARKLNTTDRIAKYLQAGVTASAGSQDAETAEKHSLLLADRALYVATDTVEALSIKKKSLGPDWETKPRQYYNFAGWCWGRGINLEEAEMYARKAAGLAGEGTFKASHLNVLAEICHTRGKTDEAVRLIEEAIAQDPDNTYYPQQLERFQNLLTDSK